MKKYEMTDNYKMYGSKKVYQIRALADFGDVAAGTLGGYIEREENLMQDGNAWVDGNALVRGDAVVEGNAWVDGNAVVRDNAVVDGNARVRGNALVRGDAVVDGNAVVRDNAVVDGKAVVRGNAVVDGNARARGNAEIYKSTHILSVNPLGSRNNTVTFYRTAEGIEVACGCFTGDINTFLEKVQETHGNNKYAQEYKLAAELARLHIQKG